MSERLINMFNHSSIRFLGRWVVTVIAATSFLSGMQASNRASNAVDTIAYATAQGKRPTMEDAHSIIPVCEGGHALMALFDGHGGAGVACYAARKLPYTFNNIYRSTPLKSALAQAFKTTHEGLVHAGIDAAHTGSTALVSVVVNRTIAVANAGDSRAVLCRDGIAVPLSWDHKPNRLDEQSRIKKAGGTVITYGVPRVGGVLAVSRALGDTALSTQGVIPDPEITVCTITPADEFVIMACDGLWDVVSNQDAVDKARKIIRKNEKKSVQKAADSLKDWALQQGSSDNITVIIFTLQADKV